MPDHKASSTVPLWNDKFRGGKTTYDSYSEWKCWTEGNFGKPAQREIAFYQKDARASRVIQGLPEVAVSGPNGKTIMRNGRERREPQKSRLEIIEPLAG